MEKLWYRECNTGRRFILKLEPGAHLIEALLEFARAKALPFASLVSAVGSVRDVAFTGIQAGAHLPMTEARTKTVKLDGPLELLGLQGNIAPTRDDADGVKGEHREQSEQAVPPSSAKHQLAGEFQILASKSSGDVVGGRLLDAVVFATCEIVLAEYLVQGIERHHSATSGVDTIFIEESRP